MAEGVASWSRGPSLKPVDPNEKLFLFGYSCKIFPNDDKSLFIGQGKHLIPWMGDETLMIDRYDVRGYLHDLKQYEPVAGDKFEDPISEEEKLCDEERYRSLRSDLSEEQLYQEEELKRLRAAIACDGAYHEIAFTYENAENANFEEPAGLKVEEPEDELYECPEGLTIPKGMEVPYNMKIHTIIERTAQFISEQGGQMEIIIKMKQHANPQFGFMHLDNPLHPYYKHLVKEIKSGSYKPIQERKRDVSRSEDEDDDGHYLHPSLMSGRVDNAPKFTVPSINFRRSHDDSYSVLVRNLKQHVEEAAKEAIPEVEYTDYPPENNSLVNYYNDGGNAFSGQNEESVQMEYQQSPHPSTQQIIPPSPDLLPIIDKMAEYVAKNGEDFETIVKSKNDPRFAFLNAGNEFNDYYLQRREYAKHQIRYYAQQAAHALSTASSRENTSSVAPSPEVRKDDNGQETFDPKDEYDALYSQDSGEVASATNISMEIPTEEGTTDSLDFLDSPGTPQSLEETKGKAKALKGPISFSLKMKDSETPPPDKIKIPLLGDSDEDSSEENKKEQVDSSSRRNRVSEDNHYSHHDYTTEGKDRSSKTNSDSLDTKIAEDRIKDKLLAAARERLAQQKKEKQQQMEQQKREEQQKKDRQLQLDQQRKDKQLQLERKRKAALFLKMLKKRSPERIMEATQKAANDKHKGKGKLGSDFWSLAEASEVTSPELGILFPANTLNVAANNSMGIPGIKTEWSSASESEHSGEEEFISGFGSDSEFLPVVKAEPEEKVEPKKKKKRSHSKSKERSHSKSKSSRKKERHRSKFPKSHKHEKSKKEKELPAAYALVPRPRSRSRSPRRYRSNPNYWNRRR
ncbi:splicing factor, suppressor of white-apricot homolog [Uloborus diversus]|uniref:splicing factor, suppressor of white-apricot homolog n=1 Tax=Uloborus diversus TaxID=327109 RepID=UPI0024090753|nr:splicing factor, suppressor of white-apricot homolog [Uloborus diversus]